MTLLTKTFFFHLMLSLIMCGTFLVLQTKFEGDNRHGEMFDEQSSLREISSIPLFVSRHSANVFKRFYYRYLLADFGVATINTLLGIPLVFSGLLYGIVRWYASSHSDIPATAGQVMLAALPLIIGTHMLTIAISYDIASEPRSLNKG